MKKILIIFAAIIFSACGSISPTFRETEKEIVIPKNKSLIYVYGDPGMGRGIGDPIKFVDNGVMEGVVDGGRYMKYFAAPGLHKVKTEFSHTTNPEETLTFEEGKVYFLKVLYYHDPMEYYGKLSITQMYGKSALEEIRATRLQGNKS